MSRAGEARTADFFSADNFLLGEGSLYERLRRDPAVTFDRQLAHGGLLYDDSAADVLEAVHRAYLDIGQSHRIPMIASTATWKANGERIAASGFAGKNVNADNVRFLRGILERLFEKWRRAHTPRRADRPQRRCL